METASQVGNVDNSTGFGESTGEHAFDRNVSEIWHRAVARLPDS